MKRFFFLVLATTLFCSCSRKLERLGYSTQTRDYWDCDVPIRKNMVITDTLQKIGEFVLGKCRSKICNEEQSRILITREGCACDADVVNIIDENNKQEWNSCYKCRAEFYVKKVPDGPTYVEKRKGLSPEQVGIITSLSAFILSTFVYLFKTGSL